MAEFDFVELSKELDNVEESGVSFQGKSQSWGTEDEVGELVKEIEKCSNLVYLNLEGNTLGADAAVHVGKALEKHPEFKKALWKDLFTGRLKTEIPEALKHLGNGIICAGAQLSVLDCSDNALGPNGMVGLVNLLQSSACYSLQELKLNNCGLGITGGKMLAEALMECYKKGSEVGTPLALKVFIAGRNRLENEGAKALANVFAELKTLEELALPQNGIYHVGISALSEALKENKNMKILNLNDNTIQTKGAAALVGAITVMTKLREINFGDCLLKSKGAHLIGTAILKNHPELEVVNFGFNEIGPIGGLSVTGTLLDKLKLRQAVLGGNQFGSKARKGIREMMKSIGKLDALESLSEDESEGDNDNEFGDSEEEEVTDEEDNEELNYVTALSNKSLETIQEGSSFAENNSSIVFTGEEIRPNTIETFCNTPNPSIKMFTSLPDADKVQAFRDHLHMFNGDDYLINLVFTTLKCAALSDESEDALEVASALYSDSFEYAEQNHQITRVKNFFLIQLGLLKCEDKTFKPAYNMHACRYALKHTLSQKTFIDDIQKSFDLFLSRCE